MSTVCNKDRNRTRVKKVLFRPRYRIQTKKLFIQKYLQKLQLVLSHFYQVSCCWSGCLTHAAAQSYRTILSHKYIVLQHQLSDSSLSLWRVSLSEEFLSQFVVAPLLVHQFLVSPSLLNSAVTDHNDLICLLNGLQPVSDHQQGLVGTTSQGLLNLSRVNNRNIYYLSISLCRWKQS